MRRAMFNQWLLPASLLANLATGLLIQPTNTTQDSSAIQLILPTGPFSNLEPLTSNAGNFRNGLTDILFHVTPQNQNSLVAQDIAYISCDSGDYPGFTSLNDVFQTALAVNVTAVIFYSLTAQQCNITQQNSAFQYMYSMSNQTKSRELLQLVDGNDHISATVAHSASSSTQNTSNASQTPSSYGSSPTTAVAMIILYSVTGIITALFLIIIITGAVRAHRHPERYGPRNVVGRARQTRARGIARAMLDTIPVVKFGEQKPEPKSTDVELADTDTPVVRRSVENDGTQETTTVDQAAPRQSMTSVRSGIGAATGHIDNLAIAGTIAPESGEALGCSICTDDFEMGQDLRVLPCDHKFHPACIDPWLLNVSSTCPLCRIDLRPEGSTEADAATAAAGENGELPPPINGYNGQPYRVSMRRSLLIGLGLDRGHYNPQQRIAAARELSTANREGLEAQQEQGEEANQRRRLRERFGIRTRRRGQSDAQAPTPVVPEESTVETQAASNADVVPRDGRPTNL